MMKIYIYIWIAVTYLFSATPEKAPEWVLQNTLGENVALYDFRGKVVIVNFWAIWCSTCKPELIELSQLQEEMVDQGVRIVGIGVDSGDKEFLREFKKLIDIKIPLLSGNRRQVKRILRNYGNIRQIPTMIVIDKNGNIIHKINGFKHKEELKKLIRPLL